MVSFVSLEAMLDSRHHLEWWLVHVTYTLQPPVNDFHWLIHSFYLLNEWLPHKNTNTSRLMSRTARPEHFKKCYTYLFTYLLWRRTVTSLLIILARRQSSVGIDQKELGGGRASAAEMFEILPRDWNLKPIFTQKWASVDMNWEGRFNPPPNTPDNSNPASIKPALPTSQTLSSCDWSSSVTCIVSPASSSFVLMYRRRRRYTRYRNKTHSENSRAQATGASETPQHTRTAST